MTALPSCEDAAAVARALPVVEPGRVARAASAAQERPIAYRLGSGEADEVALFAGLKPLVRQLLPAAWVPAARAKFAPLGLALEEAATVGTAVQRRGSREDPGLRTLFVSRDAALAQEAARLESSPDHDRELGGLLGYPRCCVDAYLETQPPRRNGTVVAAAWARTRQAGQGPRPRLNVLDLAVFHYVSWLPCSFACRPSLAHADAVAAHLARRHGQFLGAAHGAPAPAACPPGCRHQAFVAAVDAALSAHRLYLQDDVQLSLTGALEGGAVRVGRAWATARDRHPAAGLEAAPLEAVARLQALVAGAATVAVEPGPGGGVLLVDGRPVLSTREAALVPFGA